LLPDDQVHPDTHVLTVVNNVIGVVNYVIAACPSLLNFVIADSPLIRMSATHTSGAANAIAAPLGKTCHRSPVVTVSEQESAPPGRRLRRSNRTRSACR
jgi:hypothetical protein